MRIAVLSDIHGNSLALDAVLQDVAQQGGADAYWVVGDLAALGPDPVGSLERLAELPNATFVRGNTDRYVCGLLSAKELAEPVRQNPALAEAHMERLAMLAWTQGALIASGWMNWMSGMPLERRTTLPDGTRVLLVHAAPGTDDGDGIRPTHTDNQLAEIVSGADADLIFVGHTHWQLDRKAGGTRIINLGSVSNPPAPDLRASYYLIEADEKGHSAINRRVDYDHEAVIAQLQRRQHPGIAFISRFMHGEQLPPWAK